MHVASCDLEQLRRVRAGGAGEGVSTYLRVESALYLRYVTDQFICSYNFVLVIPQYRILPYLSLSLSLLPRPSDPAPSDRACQLSHTPDGITGISVDTLC